MAETNVADALVEYLAQEASRIFSACSPIRLLRSAMPSQNART